MNGIFQSVYEFLKWLAALTGLTYEEITIIAYYFCFPLVFVLLRDRIFRTWVCTALLLLTTFIALLLIPNFTKFSKDLFGLSVLFLNEFARLGWNYTEASVYICVVFPGIVLVILTVLAFRRAPKQPAD